jgi:hypothetical protein
MLKHGVIFFVGSKNKAGQSSAGRDDGKREWYRKDFNFEFLINYHNLR